MSKVEARTDKRLGQDYLDLRSIIETPEETLDFVLPGLLAETVGVLLSPGGVGKSMLALELAATVATGRDAWGLVGADPAPGTVIYLSLEDPEIVFRQRVRALEASRPGMMRDAEAGLRLTTRHGAGFELATWEEKKLRPSAHFNSLKREMVALQRPRLLIIDTLNRALAGLPENDNSVQSRVLNQIEQLISGTGAAALLIHHTSKGATRDGQGDTQHSARGAGAISDNARLVMNLTSIKPKKEANQPETQTMLKLNISKCNYAACPQDLVLWRDEAGVLQAMELIEVPTPRPSRRGKSDR